MSLKVLSIEKDTKEFIKKNNSFYSKTNQFNDCIVPVKNFGSWHKPNLTVKSDLYKSSDTIHHADQLVYDTTYSFDSKGRRFTPEVNKDIKSYNLFFGDAMCFGEGVDDYSTLPYFIEKLIPNTRSINYGAQGHGPQHFLKTVLSENFKEEFKGRLGTVYYLYRDDAIKTANGKVPWAAGTPKYIKGIENGLHKPFLDGQYLSSEFTDNDYSTTKDIFKKSIFNLPNFNFKIIYLPLSFSSKYFNEFGFDYFNFSTVDLGKECGNNARLINGCHTKETNLLLAKLIASNINYKFNDFKRFTDTEEELEENFRNFILELPTVEHFLRDDVGEILAKLIKDHRGKKNIDIHKYINIAKTLHKVL
jgi:hypothetical protein